MRNLFPLLILVILGSMPSMAQNGIIYTTNNDGLNIRDRKINVVEYGNILSCAKSNVDTKVKSYVVFDNGQKIQLREAYDCIKENEQIAVATFAPYDNDYSYYQKTYKRAIRQRNIGIILTAGGMGLVIGSFIASSNDSYISDKDLNIYKTMFIAGDVVLAAGLAVWISGGVKAHHNRVAMEEIKLSKVSIAPTQNGMGLVFAFN